MVRFARTADGWTRHTVKLLGDPARCLEEGQALAEHVRANYHLDAVNEHRRQILEG
ncbi:hypothetical protein D3C84_1160550 [compost metagenome]